MRDADILKDTPPEHHFWARDGNVIKNLHDLKAALEKMDDATFRHHVNSEKNDFNAWIKHVLNDHDLAEDILKANTRHEMARLIDRAVKEVLDLEEKKEKVEEVAVHKAEPVAHNRKIEEILQKEKEIEKREEKIEKILQERVKENVKPCTRFFTKEFVQGIVVGILLAVLGGLFYIKFFAI